MESLAGGFRLLLVAVGIAPWEVVAFLEENGRVAVNHISRIKIHLEHKPAFIENKLKLEKMPAHSTKCLFLKVGYSDVSPITAAGGTGSQESGACPDHRSVPYPPAKCFQCAAS